MELSEKRIFFCMMFVNMMLIFNTCQYVFQSKNYSIETNKVEYENGTVKNLFY